jgi:hypothetical protein
MCGDVVKLSRAGSIDMLVASLVGLVKEDTPDPTVCIEDSDSEFNFDLRGIDDDALVDDADDLQDLGCDLGVDMDAVSFVGDGTDGPVGCGVECDCAFCRGEAVDVSSDEGEAPLRIPCAVRGGQLHETEVYTPPELVVRIRVRAKCHESKSVKSIRSVRVLRKPAAAPNAKKNLKHRIKPLRAVNRELNAVVTMVVRKVSATRRGEAYLLDGAKKYIGGLTSNTTNQYVEHVRAVSDAIKAGEIKCTDDAKRALSAMI